MTSYKVIQALAFWGSELTELTQEMLIELAAYLEIKHDALDNVLGSDNAWVAFYIGQALGEYHKRQKELYVHHS